MNSYLRRKVVDSKDHEIHWRKAKRVWEDAGGKRRTRWWYEPKDGEVL